MNYPTALLFAREVYFDNCLTGKAKRKLHCIALHCVWQSLFEI